MRISGRGANGVAVLMASVADAATRAYLERRGRALTSGWRLFSEAEWAARPMNPRPNWRKRWAKKRRA